jgi:hypothetical protein
VGKLPPLIKQKIERSVVKNLKYKYFNLFLNRFPYSSTTPCEPSRGSNLNMCHRMCVGVEHMKYTMADFFGMCTSTFILGLSISIRKRTNTMMSWLGEHLQERSAHDRRSAKARYICTTSCMVSMGYCRGF